VVLEVLNERRVALLKGTDPLKDLEGLELLLGDCQKRAGQFHFLTLQVKCAMCVKLVLLGRFDEAVKLGYEVSARLVEHYGLRQPVTVDANITIMGVLWRSLDSTALQVALPEFIGPNLEWLLDSDSLSLDPTLLGLKEEIKNIFQHMGLPPDMRWSDLTR
jgi:hypothetical protein